MNLYIPQDYEAILHVREVEVAIKTIKDFFEHQLSEALNLTRVTAPIFVRAGTGLNDDLNGIELPVSFQVSDDGGATVEMVQSLAKWKRHALSRYGFDVGEGLYTDMNAVRPDETLDNLHSIYVDQWDWEKVIAPEERSRATLEHAVEGIYDAIRRTELYVAARYRGVDPILPRDITFITSEDLQARFPELSPHQREDKVCEELGAVFIVGIGADLADGAPHDGRAPDYDDWITLRPDGGRGLNGDILVWNPVLKRRFELSSMGVRVSPTTLAEQLELRDAQDRAKLFFHSKLLAGELPQTMGGGIGQSRLCMYYLRAAHIGEVAVGIWPDEMVRRCNKAGITLL